MEKINKKYQILTDSGFKNFSGIKIQEVDNTVKLVFDDSSHLTCTLSHQVKLITGEFKYAFQLNIGDITSTNKKILEIHENTTPTNVYDILGVEDTQAYTTNGVESHNCAFVEDWNDFYKSVYPTISSGKETKVVFTSCVPKNTLVYTDRGLKYVSEFIDDTRDGGYIVSPYTIQGHTKSRTSNIFHNNGFRKTKIIKTTSGEVESTLNHKFWAYKDGNGYDWYKSEDLSIGDYIASQAGYNLWGNWTDCSDFTPTESKRIKYHFSPKTLTPEICYFIGLYIAEGSRKNNYGITITCGDDISKSITDLGLSYYTKDGIHYEISSLHLIEFMNYLGFDIKKTAKHKIIPPKLLTTTKENIIALLRGMFDGDGCITIKNGQPRISYTSTSKELIKQIKMLLLNFGIFSSIYSNETPPTKKTKVWSYSEVIDLNARQSIQFNTEIGFGLKRKSERINLDIKLRNGSPSDIIPNSYTYLKNAGAKVFCGLTSQKTTNLSRYKMIELRDKIEENNYYGSEELRQFYQNNVSENIRWEIIKEISYGEADTYDFSLPDDQEDNFCHSVIYNGYIGHQTPNGLNHYHDLWDNSIKGKNEFIPIKVTWRDVPGRDEAWKAQTIANTSMEAFVQEHEAEFVGSSGTLIDGWKLKELQTWDTVTKNNFTSVYEVPIKESEYVVVCDVSRGKGIDNSAFTIIKTSELPYKVVATYYCPNIPPDMYAEVIYRAHKHYNDAYVVVENNDAGCETLRVLHDTYECETILGQQIDNSWIKTKKLTINGGNGFELGVRTTKTVKAVGCARLKTLVENNTLEFGDRNIIDELNRYSKKGTSYAAEEGAHDDLVATLVMFSWLTTQDIFVNMTNIEVRQNIRDAYEPRFEEELAPFGYIFNGLDNIDDSGFIDDIDSTRHLLGRGNNIQTDGYKDYFNIIEGGDDDPTVFPLPNLGVDNS